MKTKNEIEALWSIMTNARTELRTALLKSIREAVSEHGHKLDEDEIRLDLFALLGDGMIADEVTCVILDTGDNLVAANDNEDCNTLLVDNLNDDDLYDLYRAVSDEIAGQQ